MSKTKAAPVVQARDVAGHPLNVGDTVAFCLGGTGTVMKTGVITDIAAKTVLVSHRVRKYRLEEPEEVFTRRTFDAVCFVFSEIQGGE